MKPTFCARQLVSWPSLILSMRLSSNSIVPLVGRSVPPSRLSRVVLPEPDGPISARNSPCSMRIDNLSKIEIFSLPRV